MGILNKWLHKKDKDADQKKSGLVKAAKEAKKDSKADAKKTSHDHDHKDDKKSTEVAPAKNKLKLADHSTAYKVLLKPMVTEKSAIAESKNKYSFMIARDANKNQVKQAVFEIYGVKPEKINIINTDGRRVRFGRSMGRRGDYKKAIITLPTGSTIDIHAGV